MIEKPLVVIDNKPINQYAVLVGLIGPTPEYEMKVCQLYSGATGPTDPDDYDDEREE